MAKTDFGQLTKSWVEMLGMAYVPTEHYVHESSTLMPLLSALRAWAGADYRSLACQARIVRVWRTYSRGRPGHRKDLLGIIDCLALGDGVLLGIQYTDASNAAARVRKIQTECRENAEAWLRAGARLEVWGWKKHANMDPKYPRRKWRPKRQVIHYRKG